VVDQADGASCDAAMLMVAEQEVPLTAQSAA
jgi:hypothetical protein